MRGLAQEKELGPETKREGSSFFRRLAFWPTEREEGGRRPYKGALQNIPSSLRHKEPQGRKRRKEGRFTLVFSLCRKGKVGFVAPALVAVGVSLPRRRNRRKGHKEKKRKKDSLSCRKCISFSGTVV